MAILSARIYEKVMRPNILALPRAILQKLLLLYVILTDIIVAQLTDMQYIILCLDISNRNI